MQPPESLRWSQLRPATTGAWVAAGAAGLVLLNAVGVAVNMVWLTGRAELGGQSMLAFMNALYLLVFLPPIAFLAVLAWRGARARLTAVLLGLLALVTLPMALVPTAAQWAQARDLDVDVSLTEYVRYSHGSGERISTQSVTTADGAVLGLELWADPAGTDAGPLPAVVLIHGGAWTSGKPGSLPEWNKLVAGLGFVVIDVSYRIPDSTPTGFRPEMEIGDVKCAIGWVYDHAAEMGVDPTRISAMGHSAGGNLALLAGYAVGDPAVPPTCEAPDVPIRSVVSIYGPADLRELWNETGSPAGMHSILREYLGGSPDEVPDRYDALSPITYVDGDEPPTFSIMGLDDQLVPPSDLEAFAAALEAAGVEHEEWWITAADHAFDTSWGTFGTQIARAKVTDFLRRHG